MKKLYLFFWLYSILIVFAVFLSTGISPFILLCSQIFSIILLNLMKKTGKKVFFPSKDSFLKSVIFNVFASDKEIKLMEETEWTQYIEINKKHEILDNK